ncbi:MAG TPA: DUF481 domain-containing protein [Vicinamibacterales bacterium]|nr:DUF481 domain-containing protein [Vicinamibacterales bacterium]
MRALLRAAAVIGLLGAAARPVWAQPPVEAQPPAAAGTEALRVFLDCDACDSNFLRTEITFVNYVRDRVGADVHVLVTTEPTAGGGTLYTIRFIGLDRFKDIEQTLTYAAPQAATSDERRRGFASVFKLGLVRYALETPIAPGLSVTFADPKRRPGLGTVRDPWNLWVFRLGANGSFEGEESTSEWGMSAFCSANRTTEAWKINLNAAGEYEEERFDLEEEGTFTAVRRESELEAVVVRSISPHWSLGGTAELESSTFENYDLRTRVGPGIEFNVFPYAESTRRILTLFYSVGVQRADYTEETIFGKLSETLLDHQFEILLGLRQPWGSAEGGVETAQYLTHTDKYRISAFGELDIRLFKGFTLDLFGRASRRRDQLSLRRGDATTEEILVRQRELATGYRYDVGFGISYSFGSVFNNVVNPRFRGVDD